MNLKGRRFGKLKVLRRDGAASGRHSRWRVTCDCGTEKTVLGTNLLKGATKSCGCLRSEMLALPYGVGSRNVVLRTYKNVAKKKGLEWALSDEEFISLAASNCHYCGLPPSNTGGSPKNNGRFVYNGIDRSDSSAGYISNNVVPACWTCNWMKRHMSAEAFLAHIDRIHAHQRRGSAAHA